MLADNFNDSSWIWCVFFLTFKHNMSFHGFQSFLNSDLKTVLRFSCTGQDDNNFWISQIAHQISGRKIILSRRIFCPYQVILELYKQVWLGQTLYHRFLCFQGGAEIVSMSAIISINVSIISVSVPKNP